MSEAAQLAILGVFGLAVSAFIGGGFALLLQRRKEPVENGNVVVLLTNQVATLSEQLSVERVKYSELAIIHAQNVSDTTKFNREQLEQSKAQLAQSAEQTHKSALDAVTITNLTAANVKLVGDVDGMPALILQKIREEGKDIVFQKQQSDMLTDTGTPIENQPVREAREAEVKTDPPDLVKRLMKESSSLPETPTNPDAQIVTVTTPAEIHVVEKPTDDNSQGVPK